MTTFDELKIKFEELERDTVSNSFGGNSLPGDRAPSFAFSPLMNWFGEELTQIDGCVFEDVNRIKSTMTPKVIKFTLGACRIIDMSV